jgi:hypothetical protein
MTIADENSCKGCPVYKHTGQVYCKNTPYDVINEIGWAKVISGAEVTSGVVSVEMVEAMYAELEFLESLRSQYG